VGYFILAGVAVVVFALNERFDNKSGQVVIDSSGRWARIPWRAYLHSWFPLGNGEVGLQSRASKFQTNHGINGDRFLCAVGCMGLRGIERAVIEQHSLQSRRLQFCLRSVRQAAPMQ
jgi:hypothetical protein